jgi:hypothetical protein
MSSVSSAPLLDKTYNPKKVLDRVKSDLESSINGRAKKIGALTFLAGAAVGIAVGAAVGIAVGTAAAVMIPVAISAGVIAVVAGIGLVILKKQYNSKEADDLTMINHGINTNQPAQDILTGIFNRNNTFIENSNNTRKSALENWTTQSEVYHQPYYDNYEGISSPGYTSTATHRHNNHPAKNQEHLNRIAPYKASQARLLG